MAKGKQERSLLLPVKWGVILVICLLLLTWLGATPGGLLGKADALGYAVCHRIDERSFHVNGRQFPLCARCTGQFLGAFLGLVYLGYVGRHQSGLPARKLLPFFGLFCLAYALDGINSFLHLPPLLEAFPQLPRIYEPNNTLRLFTGTGMGLTIAAFILPVFNLTIWRDYTPSSTLDGFRRFGIFVLLALIMDILVLTEQPIILYPLAIISSVTIIILLMLVYSMLLAMFFKHENRYNQMKQIVFLLCCGFLIALLQVAIFDWLRYMWTGTWGGFNLG